MKTLGLRHVALNVKNAQLAKDFYIRVLKMKVEWEPDPKSVYLTSANTPDSATHAQNLRAQDRRAQDNLALHEVAAPPATPSPPSHSSSLNHLGFVVPTPEDVDAWYAHVKKEGAKILKDIKTHRDGARSFYFADLDGTVIQILYHPPIASQITTQAAP